MSETLPQPVGGAIVNDELAEHVVAIHRLVGQMRSDAVEIGRHLAYCHEKVVEHGDWGNWLTENFGWTPRHALNFMNAYKFARDKSEIISDLKIPATAIFMLSAPSTPLAARDEVIERAKRGTAPKVAEVKEAIARHKASSVTPTDVTDTPSEIASIDDDDPHAAHRARMAALAAADEPKDTGGEAQETNTRSTETLLEHWHRASTVERDELFAALGLGRWGRRSKHKAGKPYDHTLELKANNSAHDAEHRSQH